MAQLCGMVTYVFTKIVTQHPKLIKKFVNKVLILYDSWVYNIYVKNQISLVLYKAFLEKINMANTAVNRYKTLLH